MKNDYFLKHAQHNEKLSKELFAGGVFFDWVITTAYYSSIYYVCYALFPDQYEIDGKLKQCVNFDDYYNKLPPPRDNKHSTRLDLVADKMPEIHTQFATLKDSCWTARYKRYRMLQTEAQIALDCLRDISALCI